MPVAIHPLTTSRRYVCLIPLAAAETFWQVRHGVYWRLHTIPILLRQSICLSSGRIYGALILTPLPAFSRRCNCVLFSLLEPLSMRSVSLLCIFTRLIA